MTDILIAGSATVDFLFEVDELPSRMDKYRARNAQIVGGGCAANAAVAISRLGAQARIAARLAEDPVGQMIVAGLQLEKVATRLIDMTTQGRSAYSSIYVLPNGERQIVSFRGENLAQLPDWPEAPFDAALADTRWPEAAVEAMIRARALGVPGVMDAEAPIVPEALTYASHIAFSRQGLDDYMPGLETEAALAEVARRHGGWVCVTDGAHGVTWCHEGEIGHVPAFEVDVVDTLGAGDVWHGAFTLGLAEMMSVDGAIRFANAAAALKCTRPGGRLGAPDRDETEDFLKERNQ